MKNKVEISQLIAQIISLIEIPENPTAQALMNDLEIKKTLYQWEIDYDKHLQHPSFGNEEKETSNTQIAIETGGDNKQIIE